MRGAISVILCVVAAAAARPAVADDPAAAEAAFQEAVALRNQGDYARACPKFAASYRLDPALGALLNLADCHEKLGKTATAWAQFREAAEMARKRGDNREDYASDRAAALLPRLVRLRVIAPDETPEGLTLHRDGREITALVGTAVPVDPGTYVIEASAPGYARWRREVSATAEGETIEVRVPPLEPAPDEPESQPIENAGEGEPEAAAAISWDRREQRRRRWIAGGVGAAGLTFAVTGLGLGARAKSQWSSAKKECSDGVCTTQDGRDRLHAAKASARAADVLVGLGLASAVTGVVLWLTAPPAQRIERPNDRVTLTPLVGDGSVGAVLQGSF